MEPDEGPLGGGDGEGLEGGVGEVFAGLGGLEAADAPPFGRGDQGPGGFVVGRDGGDGPGIEGMGSPKTSAQARWTSASGTIRSTETWSHIMGSPLPTNVFITMSLP